MYGFRVELDSFGRLPEAVAVRLLAGMVNAVLAEPAREWIEHNGAPLLYESGLYYADERDDVWLDVPAMLVQRAVDCEDLAGYRIGELRAAGYDAEVVVTVQRSRGEVLYHVQVETPWGLEDPSRRLGMKG